MPTYLKFSNNDYTLHNDKVIDFVNLYKKCGFKKEENFGKLFTFSYDKYFLEFWGRNKGETKNINTYDLNQYNFKDNIYGKFLCIIKNTSDDEYISFEKDLYEKINSEIYSKYCNNDKVIMPVKEESAILDNSDSSNCSSDSDSDYESEPIYDSELQYEDYDYSD